MADPGFQYSIWAQRFPTFAVTIQAPFAQLLYSEALLIPEGSQITNNWCLPSSSIIVMMNLLVAHLAFLTQRDPSAVGRISDATQGSVSTSLSYPSDQGATQSWYAQSQYGAELWRMMAPYRTARYVLGPAVIARPGLGVSLFSNVVQIGNQNLGVGGWPWQP